MSTNASEPSISPENMRRNSSLAIPFSSFATSAAISATVASSSSAIASSISSSDSRKDLRKRSSVPTTSSSRALRRPSSWARSGSFQTSG